MVYKAAFYTIYVDVNYLFRLIGYSYTPCKDTAISPGVGISLSFTPGALVPILSNTLNYFLMSIIIK